MDKKTPSQSAEKKVFWLAVMLIVSSFFLMGQFTHAVKKADDDQFWEFSAMFNEIYKEVRDRYVEPVDQKKLFEGALQGMFLTLDQHSQYMDPDSYAQLEKDTEGGFSGVGLQIALRGDVLTVITPIPGSPAAKAGVHPWDRIVEIDEKKTYGISLTDAVKKLTGPSGTTVKITVYREGTPGFLHFTLVRQNIKVESVHSQLFGDVGYIRVTKFSDNTTRDLRRVLEEFKKQNVKGLIVDLRFNTGGLLKEAVEMSNLFVGRGKVIVSTKGRLKNQNQEFRADSDPVTDLPLLVLINRSSASASEIFAGAMKDLGRGTILGIKGQRSFGKGSVQTIEELTHSFEKDANGNIKPAAIRLTTAKYYTPSGVSIDKVGVTPDIAVEMPKDAEIELMKHGQIGDAPSNEDDETTSKSRFRWNSENGTSEIATMKNDEAVSITAASDENGEESLDEENLMGSAVVSADSKSTEPKPKLVIPLDRELYPGGETEAEAAKKLLEEKKKNGKRPFVDYQLEIARRVMRQHLDEGKPFVPATEPAKPEVAEAAKESGTTATTN